METSVERYKARKEFLDSIPLEMRRAEGCTKQCDCGRWTTEDWKRHSFGCGHCVNVGQIDPLIRYQRDANS